MQPVKSAILSINDLRSKKCDDTKKWRTSELSMIFELSLSFTVFMNLLAFIVHSRACNILVMFDHSDMFSRRAFLPNPNRASVSTYHLILMYWSCYFDSPCYTVVHWGFSKFSTEISTFLFSQKIQLCLIRLRAPVSFRENDASQKFLRKSH